MLDKLNELMRFLEQEETAIENYLSTGELSSCLFDDPVVVNGKQERRSSKLVGRKGIYLFRFKEDVSLSYGDTSKWGRLKGAGFKTWGEKNINKGEYLYIGSCISFSLYSRINQHYGNNETYSALNLSNPNRILLKDLVLCYSLPIKKEFEGFSKIILPTIEKKLHERLNPYTGSSRT